MKILRIRNFRNKIEGYYQRKSAHFFAKRKILWTGEKPVISFTFDDFPRSSFILGGKILGAHHCLGTYFASLGLAGASSPSGELFSWEDLKELLSKGHEVGCHTYNHLDAWKTTPRLFRESIIKNREAMRSVFPGHAFRSFAYPLTEPQPRIKRIAQEYFTCCRGGGRALNSGWIDLNLLKSFFIDIKSRNNLDYFRGIIEKNRVDKSWLILSTHDISENPSDYGCSPELFEEIVRYAVDSSADILPLAQVISRLTDRT